MKLPRWYRFRLATLLLLVTLFACGLAWTRIQLNWIRDRHNAWKSVPWPPYSWDGPFRFETYGNVKRIRGEPVQAPWSLRIFGETGTTGIWGSRWSL